MKADRTIEHFVDITKEMIRNNGMSDISVRKIADQAGFAYKSLYNHFGSLDTLLWHVRAKIIEEISDYLNQHQPEAIQSSDAVRKLFENYIDYFVQNPNYYKFLFFHQLDPSAKTESNITESEGFMNSISQAFDFMKSSYGFADNQVINCVQTLINVSQGLLTSYIAGNDLLDEKEVYKQFRGTVDILLRRS